MKIGSVCLLLLMAQAVAEPTLQPVQLGRLLFFDPQFSRSGQMSCSTCHEPDHAFIDARDTPAQGMISAGDPQESFGIRNAPSAAYAASSPAFHYDEIRQQYIGGQFWDGRALNLAEQIGGPLLTDFEMNMGHEMRVVARLEQDKIYAPSFHQLYGVGVFEMIGKPGFSYQVPRAYDKFGQLIAAYERSPALNRYDSKYDRYLAGEIALSAQEEAGRALFFDRERSRCSECHRQNPAGSEREPFSTYAYYNLGVPANPELIRLAKRAPDYVDHGLMDNPRTDHDPSLDGKFKTPSLRNVAVTAPYMHNGVFRRLSTAIAFHTRFNSAETINPETGRPWRMPEVPATVEVDKLVAPSLSAAEIEDLEAFLRTLTDAPYEKWLPEQGD